MRPEMDFVGIDYGSKLAGTTALAYVIDHQIVVRQSERRQDADNFIKNLLEQLMPSKAFIDAPLSLPGAYSKLSNDYFYREADRLTQAMSPMFLGGLTARAMRLNAQINHCSFIECYPSFLIKHLQLKSIYNKKSSLTSECLKALQDILPLKMAQELDNWHQFDAVLCWLTGYRESLNICEYIGNKEEGQICI